MKKQNGFTVLEVLVIILIVGVIAGAAWLVYSRRNDSQKQASSTSGGSQKSDATPSYTYTLPTGWQKRTCTASDVTAVFLSPANDHATDCADRTNIVEISEITSDVAELPHCLSQEELANTKLSSPNAHYSCATLTVGGKQVIKEISKQDAGTDGSLTLASVSYSFVQKRPLIFAYYGTADGTLPEANPVEQLVKSVTFN